MKKTLAVALAGLALPLSPAFAQSSVTLYGLVDAGISRIENGGGDSSTHVRSGNAYSSRLGWRGTEDLGNGLKAMFTLEAGVNIATGATSTPYFNRQSWVGLASSDWGQLTLGRQLPSIADAFIPMLNASYFGNHAAAIDGAAIGSGSSVARFNNMIGGTRVDNAVKYQSPILGGLKLHAMATSKEPGTTVGRMLSLGATYSSEHIDAGLVVHDRRCAEDGGCPAGKAKDRIWGLGASYKLDGARYGVIYTRQKNALTVQGNDADVIDLLARVPFGAWILAAGYQYLNDRTALNQDTRQLNLGTTYVLSKRTSLYGIFSRQTAKNGGKAGMYSVTSTSGRQNQLSVGMVHTF
ncbi:porin [Pseudorhodoferax sp.]|uniref:porin n=1 Tax=Pseudorhodoferax sp. TaxID=1993553 RepID=UPI0039E33D2C